MEPALAAGEADRSSENELVSEFDLESVRVQRHGVQSGRYAREWNRFLAEVRRRHIDRPLRRFSAHRYNRCPQRLEHDRHDRATSGNCRHRPTSEQNCGIFLLRVQGQVRDGRHAKARKGILGESAPKRATGARSNWCSREGMKDRLVREAISEMPILKFYL